MFWIFVCLVGLLTAEPVEDPFKTAERSAKIWIEFGSIVIQTDDHIFRTPVIYHDDVLCPCGRKIPPLDFRID